MNDFSRRLLRSFCMVPLTCISVACGGGESSDGPDEPSKEAPAGVAHATVVVPAKPTAESNTVYLLDRGASARLVGSGTFDRHGVAVIETTDSVVGPLTVYVPEGTWDRISPPGPGYFATADVEGDGALVASGLSKAESLPEGATGSLHPAGRRPVTTPVTITATNAGSVELTVRVGDTFVTGHDGAVAFEVAAGHHELLIGGEGFQGQPVAVDIVAGEPLTRDIELTALADPSGVLTVVDEESGDVLTDARVFVQPTGTELTSPGSGRFDFAVVPSAFEIRAEGHASTFVGPFFVPGDSASGAEITAGLQRLEPRLYGDWFTCYFEDARTRARTDLDNPVVTRSFKSDGTCTVPDRPKYWRPSLDDDADDVTPVYRHDRFTNTDIYDYLPIAFFDQYEFVDADTLVFYTIAGAPSVYEYLKKDCGSSDPIPPGSSCTTVCDKMVEACAAGEDHDNALEDCVADCPLAQADFIDDGGTADAFATILGCCAAKSYPSDCSADFGDDCVKACSN